MAIYRLNESFEFPPAALAEPDGLLAVGGDLSCERLLAAYQAGIFPWYSEGEPILWWSPPIRAVIIPERMHLSRSLQKTLRKNKFTSRIDTCFAEVVSQCAQTPRKDQEGTWIVPHMQAAYCALHEAGFAHSFETFLDGRLVGGVYGVSLGGCFFAESMFAHESDAAKVAMATLRLIAEQWQFDLIDCQLENPNVMRYGAELIPRDRYLQVLAISLKRQTHRGQWQL